jgi:hypothetical protein
MEWPGYPAKGTLKTHPDFSPTCLGQIRGSHKQRETIVRVRTSRALPRTLTHDRLETFLILPNKINLPFAYTPYSGFRKRVSAQGTGP